MAAKSITVFTPIGDQTLPFSYDPVAGTLTINAANVVISGNISGNVTGNFSGTVTGNVTGNVAAANGVSGNLVSGNHSITYLDGVVTAQT
jgi:hypothetical protein